MGDLPTPRTVFTSLINSIASIPTSPAPDHGDNPATAETNPLQSVDPSLRPLLITLHVLYPSLLLPALDLLDRHLVTRIAVHPRSPATNLKADGIQESRDARTAFYLVLSAAPTTSYRRSAVSAQPAQPYVVRLQAWNCTCARFTFSAFSAASQPSTLPFPRKDGDEHGNRDVPEGPKSTGPPIGERHDQDRREGAEWAFGGVSLDGLLGDVPGGSNGGVPCCKHLLACVLAERWPSAMGKYVVEKTVGREELAGMAFDL